MRRRNSAESIHMRSSTQKTGQRSTASRNWPVVKTMQPGAKGAIKLSRRYGEALVCVRYRLSPDGAQRMTTVEVVVGRDLVQSLRNPPVAVKIYASEAKLQALAKVRGGWYDSTTRLWRMRLNDARALGLGRRIAVPENQK